MAATTQTNSRSQRSDAPEIINLIRAGVISPEQAAILRNHLIKGGIPIRKKKEGK